MAPNRTLKGPGRRQRRPSHRQAASPRPENAIVRCALLSKLSDAPLFMCPQCSTTSRAASSPGSSAPTGELRTRLTHMILTPRPRKVVAAQTHAAQRWPRLHRRHTEDIQRNPGDEPRAQPLLRSVTPTSRLVLRQFTPRNATGVLSSQSRKRSAEVLKSSTKIRLNRSAPRR